MMSLLKRVYLRLRIGFRPPPLDGMQSHRRLLFLFTCITRYARPVGEALEIGCYKAGSTVWLAKACQRKGIAPVSAVDLFTGTPQWNQQEDTFEAARTRLDSYGLQQVRLLRADSRTVPWSAPLAVLHVDGDHEYAAVKSDLSRFLPLLAKGGIAILDDYDAAHPGVLQATKEALAADAQLRVLRSNEGAAYGSICLQRKP